MVGVPGQVCYWEFNKIELRDLASIRNEYLSAGISRNDLSENPIDQFSIWLNDAIKSEVGEVSAMTLSTVDVNGQPSSRIVLLKGIEEGGFKFFTNYGSRKSRHIDQNSKVSLNFFWREIFRQVRVDGIVKKISVEESKAYFQSRPRDSQIGAWASAQSEEISSRRALEMDVKLMEQKFHGINPLPLPPFWGGYIVTPAEVEFWQGRQSRLHDRFLYKLIDGKWEMARLSP